MSQRHILDVGNCTPDHFAIRRMLEQHFDVAIDRVMHVADAIERMRDTAYDLVLVNRLIFDGGAEGIELLRRAKSDAALRSTPIMMISNYADAQAAAMREGGQPGFGKASLDAPETIARLAKILRPSPVITEPRPGTSAPQATCSEPRPGITEPRP